MSEIVVNGKAYPVTSKFAAEVLAPHPDLAARTYIELVVLRDRLLQLSTRRASLEEEIPQEALDNETVLTPAELSRLENITHVINVHNAVRFLVGRSHADFGFEGVDQVHGNRHHSECGCVRHVVFDHHRRNEKDANGEPIAPTLHPHPHPFDRTCAKHRQ